MQPEDKPALLMKLLDGHRAQRALVFGRTKHGSEKLAKALDKAGFAVASIHGNKSQGQRDRALDAFKAGDVRVLVATDVAARGLDIPDVAHVYNYELPDVPEAYVHRIGRTARAGKDGAAVAFCAPDEMSALRDIERAMRRPVPLAEGERPWAENSPPRKRGGGGGGRGRGGNQGAPRGRTARPAGPGGGRRRGAA